GRGIPGLPRDARLGALGDRRRPLPEREAPARRARPAAVAVTVFASHKTRGRFFEASLTNRLAISDASKKRPKTPPPRVARPGAAAGGESFRPVSRHHVDPPVADLVAAGEVELQRQERGEVLVVEHEGH